MKRRLIALALLFLSGSALFASAPVSPVDYGSTAPRLVISEYGTLKEVLNADGSSRFGNLNLDGFRLAYQVEGGETKTVWANDPTEATNVNGLLAGQVSVEGDSVSLTVTTNDNALEITNSFTLNEQTRMLTIRRLLKNKSATQRLRLLTTKQYLDPKLIGTDCSTNPTLLKHQVNLRATAKGQENSATLLERPPHEPPCPTATCMLNSARNLPFLDTQRIGDCQGISLEWRRPKIFAPSNQLIVSGNGVKEMHFIVRMRAN